jgi:HEPN domain-containing protein
MNQSPGSINLQLLNDKRIQIGEFSFIFITILVLLIFHNFVLLIMKQKDININKLISYWVDSADEDYITMMVMFENKRYNWSLFVGHLMMEKLLKALYVRTNNDYPPQIHNLLSLAKKCNLTPDTGLEYFFASVTAFNINARYDDYKMSFVKTCTFEFTANWIDQIKEKREWIKKQII